MSKFHWLAALFLFFSLPAYAERPDGWITTKTKLALWTAPTVNSTEINVDTVDGTVTLYGKVKTEEARQRAEAETRKVDGVRDVNNLLQVVPKWHADVVAMEDKVVKDGVKDALESDPELRGSKVRVKSVDQGVVLLGGTVTGPDAELRAVRDAQQVEGVRQVASDTKGGNKSLEEPAADTRSTADRIGGRMHDRRLTNEVKLSLLADEFVPATSIRVDTRDGKVTLFGDVPDAESKANAEAIARNVAGVTDVENALAVVPRSQKKASNAEDKQIKSNIQQAFDRREALRDVEVDVKGGVVRLTGTVPNGDQRVEAAMLCRNTRGVRAVSSDLTIKSKE